ncbi:hypothetical protein MFIFM68171_05378 [Madurella fahalii]|uniref:Uncharacterized protein n=1 Tax=Madurella fahalii TaxID=1157608 RepID=A0ABQ0GBM3_9PEZI
MPSHPEDVPPPPYTETDIFSTSGRAPSPGRRDSHTLDDQSTSSTNGDVIYTPPLTPRSSHLSNFAGEVDHAANSPAAAYFESRPAPLLSQPHIIHPITVRDGSTPDNLPYPSELAVRDVRPEDWQTFANYLMPHYSAVNNEQVIDRKLRAEGITSNSGDNKSDHNNDDTRSQTSGRSHAEAQLDQIRCPVDHADADAARRRQNIEATVREWNEGFFGPRHITIRVNGDGNSPPADEPPQPQVHMPGAWDQSFDQQGSTATAEPAPGASSRSRFGRFNPFGGGGGGGGGNSSGGRGGGRGGFRWGGISLDGERVTIGDSFVADGRTGSVRIGGIVADSNGISINGRSMFGGGFGPGRGMGRGGRGGCGYRSYPGGWPFGGGHCGGFTGRGRGHHAWGRGHSWWNPPRAQTMPQPEPSSARQDGESGADHDAPERGRGRWGHHQFHPHDSRHRSRSSSVSSTSSHSSCCSESTVGSLPDYDELRDAQLPVTKKYLQEWLHHPEQPITKEKVKQIKGEIKQARNAAPSGNERLDHIAALRREVKDLLREWKRLKKEQKRQRRQLSREKRRRRREEKRERRQVKREMRQTAREMRREQRHHPHFPPFGAVPPIPPVFPVSHGDSIPAPPPPPNPMFPFPGVTDFANPFRNHPWGWGRGAPPPPPGGIPPGAWPGGNDNADNDTNTHQGPSGDKYKAASDLEAELMVKEAELFKLHEAIALEQAARAGGSRSGGGSPPYSDADGSGKFEKKLSSKEEEALAMEREIEALAATMEALRTEADEEFARELAEEETRRARC